MQNRRKKEKREKEDRYSLDSISDTLRILEELRLLNLNIEELLVLRSDVGLETRPNRRHFAEDLVALEEYERKGKEGPVGEEENGQTNLPDELSAEQLSASRGEDALSVVGRRQGQLPLGGVGEALGAGS